MYPAIPPAAPPCSGPSPQGPVEDELHFLVACSRFETERKAAFEEITSLVPRFGNLSEQQQFTTLLCPTDSKTAKITNRLIKQLLKLRDKVEQETQNGVSN